VTISRPFSESLKENSEVNSMTLKSGLSYIPQESRNRTNHVHKWLTTERVQALLKCYFRFSIIYERESGIGLLARIEAEIERELLLDRNLINDSFLPIVSYNRAAMGDRLVERKTGVCLPAVIAW